MGAESSIEPSGGRVMEQVEVDRLRVAYERASTGPPLVLLHGGVGDGPTLWRRQLEGLCDDFTVVAWDAPGAGGSSDPPESFGMAGYADCLAGFIKRLGLERPHVAGLSFGGPLALELYRLARRRPEDAGIWPAPRDLAVILIVVFSLDDTATP